jgi:septum formation protein
MGCSLRIVKPDVDERVASNEPCAAYLARITEAKLAWVRGNRPRDAASPTAPVLVADTIVELDGAILGKPESDEEGRDLLARLSGRTHRVHTRFIVDARARHAETVTTEVHFRPLEPGEIDAYVASGEGRDKAGGYGIQGRAMVFAKAVHGSYTNVVGLPACEVYVALCRAWTEGA